jgi:hypothetical protein
MEMRDPIETSHHAPVTPTTSDIADPGPLGIGAFALTTFVLSVFNAGLVNLGVVVVLGLALAYGGLAQLLAGMWEFRKGNTFGALAFTSFGAFWISFWILLNTTPAVPAKAVGVYLLAWTIFTAYMIVPAMRTNLVVLAVFVALALTFLFLCIGALGGSNNMTKVGGWIGLITAVLAWYSSFAGVTNATWKRTVLPIWPLTR